jgi:hypothetical protein
MMKSDSSLITDQIFQGKVYSFSYYSSPEKDFQPSIDLMLIEGGKVRTFRFLRPSQIEFEHRYSPHKFGLQIEDMTDGQMEYVNLLVNGHLENVGNFKFWARNIVEISELEN